MAYSISFGAGLAHVPSEVMVAARERMHEIASAIGVLPESGVMLDSIASSSMRIYLRDWEFTYAVYPHAQQIRVHSAKPLGRKRT